MRPGLSFNILMTSGQFLHVPVQVHNYLLMRLLVCLPARKQASSALLTILSPVPSLMPTTQAGLNTQMLNKSKPMAILQIYSQDAAGHLFTPQLRTALGNVSVGVRIQRWTQVTIRNLHGAGSLIHFEILKAWPTVSMKILHE